MTELREWYAEHGICIACGRNDAVKGIKLCQECRLKQADAAAEYYEAHREECMAKMKTNGKERYRRRRESGLCVSCGKRPAAEGKVRCGICLAKNRAQQERRRRAQGAMPRYMFGNGELCWTCGKPSDGKKLCPACYEKSVRSIAYARTFVKDGWQSENFIFGRKERS